MLQVGQLVEKHISEAQENGEFDNLPGSGKRLKLNDDSLVPEALRVVCRFMKNAGFFRLNLIYDVKLLLCTS
ncbi:DnaJ family domain-containing protein [Erwinia tracheiphila]